MSVTIAVVNGKGGVGKTSFAANLAVIAAASGWRTLTVDTDRQGSLAYDLGYTERVDDATRYALEDAIFRHRPLVGIPGVRERLDAVPGGWAVTDLSHRMTAAVSVEGIEAFLRLRRAIDATEGYDVVVLDMPPGDVTVQTLGIAAADLVVVPTSVDRVSTLEGTRAVLDHLELAGGLGRRPHFVGWVVTFPLARAVRLIEQAEEQMRTLTDAPRLGTVRYAPAAASYCRAHGVTAVELAEVVRTAEPWYVRRERGETTSLPQNAEDLARDYVGVAERVLAAAGEVMR